VTAVNPGVSFVVPVLNGGRWLGPALASIGAQRDGRPFEVIAIDDGSTDGSLRLLRRLEKEGFLRVLQGERRGAAAAINAGIRHATHPIICQVDQDVILQRGWLIELLKALEDPEVAAAQGHYVTRPGAGFWARAMGRDLEHRYAKIQGAFVDHVCTGNTAYRARALHQVELLDETLGYGYDNDLSYRLQARGHRLAFCRQAISVHCWREGSAGYVRQQFGVGYGRLDVVVRHPRKVTGDDVSGTLMMLHAPVMLFSLGALIAAATAALTVGGYWSGPAAVGIAGLGVLFVERTIGGVGAWRRTGDPAALGFAIAHLVRDVAWALAIVTWFARYALKRGGRPAHSMRRSAVVQTERAASTPPLGELSILAVVPALNEHANLPDVVADLSRVLPLRNILIVDDGSTDGTQELLPQLGVRWLTLSQRLGVGGAVRAGIRFARQSGYDYVVRIDGDGQHRACDIARVLEPVLAGRAHAALGSRFLRRPQVRGWRRLSQVSLAKCVSLVTRRRVTDPTSGFWLFGPVALRLLSGHHPAGYAEPELLLFLNRNGLEVAEIPIRMRPRTAGRTSLTGRRTLVAVARTALALLVVPFRQLVDSQAHD
jgi:glycosyltransferase involved in cell wall biosynthesis